LRILFLSQKLSYANATSYAYDLAGALHDRGEKVKLCSAGGDQLDGFKERGIETFHARRNPLAYRKLIQYLREFDPELVHIQSLRSLSFAKRIVQSLGKPCVVTAHTRPAADTMSISRPMVCGAIATSDVIRESLVNQLDIPKNVVRVIKRGIDLAAFVPSSEPTWTPQDGRLPVVGTIGKLVRDKGHHVLLDAARKVLDAGVEAHFVLVGEGGDELALRRQVKALNLIPHVTFSPNVRRRDQLYSIFDVLAMPVVKTGVGVTAIEAMAMGKPLVTSGVGELLHLVRDGETGLVFPEGDAQALADRILHLLRDPSELTRIGSGARTWVEKEFALEPMVDATQEFYAECLEGLKERMATTHRA